MDHSHAADENNGAASLGNSLAASFLKTGKKRNLQLHVTSDDTPGHISQSNRGSSLGNLYTNVYSGGIWNTIWRYLMKGGNRCLLMSDWLNCGTASRGRLLSDKKE